MCLTWKEWPFSSSLHWGYKKELIHLQAIVGILEDKPVVLIVSVCSSHNVFLILLMFKESMIVSRKQRDMNYHLLSQFLRRRQTPMRKGNDSFKVNHWFFAILFCYLLHNNTKVVCIKHLFLYSLICKSAERALFNVACLWVNWNGSTSGSRVVGWQQLYMLQIWDPGWWSSFFTQHVFMLVAEPKAGKPNCTSIFQVSVCLMSANIPLTKARHMGKTKVNWWERTFYPM